MKRSNLQQSKAPTLSNFTRTYYVNENDALKTRCVIAPKAKPRLTATQKFHPDNQRLRRARIKKMGDGELDLWIAHGIMTVAATQGMNDVGVAMFRGGRAHPQRYLVSLHEWAQTRLNTLELIKQQRARLRSLNKLISKEMFKWQKPK
jgi:hypothetical protein